VRSAVVMAALEELARGGYSSFSCESVAERAGVNKTTVYRRWGTRENLMLDAMVEGARVSVPIPDTGSLLADFVTYATKLVEVVTAPTVEATLHAVAATGDRDAAFADASRSFWNTHIELAGEIVERAIARGEVPPKTAPGAVIETLIAPIHFRLLVSGEDLDAEFVQTVAEHVVAEVSAGPDGATIASRPTNGVGR
jgi:AcrR family transcriptional regulator